MDSIKVPINSIKVSPDNPRVIKKDKFKKLMKSIMEFPEMMDLRPIIVDETNTVLGGNMRLQACIDLGFSEVPILKVENLSEAQKKEFVIKDNASFGEWDWDMLANEWEVTDLSDWGLDIPAVYFDDDEEPQFDKDELSKDLDSYINNTVKQIVLYYPTEEYEVMVEKMEKGREKFGMETNAQLFRYLIDDKI